MKLLFAFLPVLALAQDLTGPRSGFVYDASAKAIRPVNGIPGAASLGDPLPTGFPIDQAEFSSPTLAYAASANQIYKISLPAGTAELIPGTQPDARLAAPGLLWSATSRTIQILSTTTGASASPSPQLPIQADGNLTAAALNQNCALLAFDSGSVESLCDDGNQTRLWQEPGANIIALAVTKTGTFAQDATRVLQLTPQLKTLSTTGTQYVGLAALNDSLLALADAKTQTLTFLNLTDSSTSAIQLLFTPTGLRHLDPQILQLGDAGPNPFEVIDGNQQNRNFFIPAFSNQTGARN